jgi:hypothetical protein
MSFVQKSLRWLAVVFVLWLVSFFLTVAIGGAAIALQAIGPQRPSHGPGGVGVMPVGGAVDFLIVWLVLFGCGAPLSGVLVTLVYQHWRATRQ